MRLPQRSQHEGMYIAIKNVASYELRVPCFKKLATRNPQTRNIC